MKWEAIDKEATGKEKTTTALSSRRELVDQWQKAPAWGHQMLYNSHRRFWNATIKKQVLYAVASQKKF